MQLLVRAARALAAFAVVATFFIPAGSLAADMRVYEMRTYTTHEGRLDALHARFRNHTNYLFVKHGMTLVGYWTPKEGPEAANTLVYMLAYPSMEARQKAWDGFRNDPEWKAAAAESEKDGKIVSKVESVFLSPTDYSPMQ